MQCSHYFIKWNCMLVLLSLAVPANYSYLPDDSTLNNLYLIMESLSSKCAFSLGKLEC